MKSGMSLSQSSLNSIDKKKAELVNTTSQLIGTIEFERIESHGYKRTFIKI